MEELTAAERERRLRRRRTHERQAVVFGSLIAGLVVAGVGSAAVYTGVVSAPFLDREFSSPPADDAASTLPPPPCPPEGMLPIQYTAISVNVYNGAGRSGLAGETSSALSTRGFVVPTAGNYPARLPGSAQIVFGEAGLQSAYTLAAHVPTPVLVMDQRAETAIDLVLGEQFSTLVDPAAVVLDLAVPLSPVEGCVPLEEARAAALPAPTPTAAPAVEGEPAPEG
ncbi:LytR C-terminal domain-containing protein [Actinotalea solisilvae]|uniref:LytR C-terminal domain-containing protein n=1 Tax=Actinotalea solisilvae TaxID=2072922 RepID=UPI0018F26B1D|nr:LytR C-terminal domain-containing protein [Actinotalea solisilvae]